MRTMAWRYGASVLGVLGLFSLAPACGETESDSDGAGADDSAGGGSANSDSSTNSGSGGFGSDHGATTPGPFPVTHTAVANTAAANSGTVNTASSAGGSPSSTNSVSVVGAGGVVISDTTTTSSVGGAGGVGAAGGGGAPPITECLGCEATTESFGDQECQVWACFAPGEGIQRLSEAGCTDLATQVPRFCCPPGVEPDCD